jgi:hypothetical protein
LRHKALKARQELGAVVERLRTDRESTGRSLAALYRTVAGVSPAAEGTAIATAASPAQEASMPDDLSNRGDRERRRIYLHEPHELRYWTEALAVSEQELRNLVEKVGPMAADIREALANQ